MFKQAEPGIGRPFGTGTFLFIEIGSANGTQSETIRLAKADQRIMQKQVVQKGLSEIDTLAGIWIGILVFIPLDIQYKELVYGKPQ